MYYLLVWHNGLKIWLKSRSVLKFCAKTFIFALSAEYELLHGSKVMRVRKVLNFY